jgi:protein arginine kinase activator
MKPKAQLNEMLQKFVMHKSMAQELADLTCEHCGLSFVEFRRHGLLGCPHDYDVFKKALEPLIERSHEDSVQHIGKVPVRIGEHVKARQTVARLKRELKQALHEEDYEMAARLRDKIENLERL